MVAYVFISIKAYMIYPHSLVRKIELEIHQKKKKNRTRKAHKAEWE